MLTKSETFSRAQLAALPQGPESKWRAALVLLKRAIAPPDLSLEAPDYYAHAPHLRAQQLSLAQAISQRALAAGPTPTPAPAPPSSFNSGAPFPSQTPPSTAPATAFLQPTLPTSSTTFSNTSNLSASLPASGTMNGAAPAGVGPNLANGLHSSMNAMSSPLVLGGNPYGGQPTPAQQQAIIARAAALNNRGATGASSATLTAPTDGGPPYKVPVVPMFTRPSILLPGADFPSIEEKDQARVKQWMERDLVYEKQLMNTKKAKKGELMELQEDLFKSQDWLGGEAPRGGRLKIRYETEKTKEQERGKRGNQRKEVKMSKTALKAVAKSPEILIPIRLEYEHEAYKLRDTFTWNVKDNIVTPEVFASHLVEDLRLPFHPFYKEIVQQIKRHIEDAHLTEEYDAHLGDELLEVREENREWFERQVKRRRLEVKTEGEEETPLTLRDFSRQEGEDEELRVMIKLDITLDSVQLVDKFEWDISDSRNSPEDFAEVFAADLGLGGEFRTAIAHSIREQIDVFVKSLCLLGHSHGHPVPDDDLRREFLPALFEPFRAEASDFTPVLNQLTPDEVERNDKEREREVRRKRRQTKGRGINLPDRDHVKTHRTLVPKPNTAPIHSFQDSRGDMVYPMPEMSEPYPIVRPVLPPKPTPEEVRQKVSVDVDDGNVVIDGDLLHAGGSRLKRLKHDDGKGSGPDRSGTNTPGDGSHRATSPPHENRTKAPATTPKQKRPPVIQPSLEELGLHEHIINGVWHCANCGVPESCAIGRRKGPSGKDSLCGDCGKFFHRFRKNRPVVYSTEAEVHLKAKRDAAAAVAASKSASSQPTPQPAAPATQPSTAAPSRASSEEADSHHGGDESDSSSASAPSRPRNARNDRDNSVDLPFVQLGSPDSDLSSRDSVKPPALPDFSQHVMPTPAPAPVVAPPPPKPPLPWMVAAANELRAKNEKHKFEVIPRPRPPDPNVAEWRVKCLDCTGKLYNLGPGETLDNFAVHLKNRQHLLNVEKRVGGGSS